LCTKTVEFTGSGSTNARSIVLRRTAAGRRAEPAIVSDGQAWQARLVRKTVACEQTLLPIWHGITAVQVRATITATAHISADLYGHELDDVASAPDAVDERRGDQ
jgi:hypothetical protein